MKILTSKFASGQNNDFKLTLTISDDIVRTDDTIKLTALLERLVDIIQPGQSILDLGTGSGILSIAAKKLGASNICALDNDDICSGNFSENMNLNNIMF